MKTIISISITIALCFGALWLYASPQSEIAAPQHENKSAVRATSMQPAVTPIVDTPSTTPSIIVVNTPTVVTITITVTPTPLANGVNLLRLGATGTQPTILGVMHDDGTNGDAVAGDGIYTLQVPFNETTAGQIQLQVSAAFQGRLTRSMSPITQVAIYGVLADLTSGFRALYPPGLLNLTDSTTPSGLFTLESSPQGVDIGGGGSEDGSSPASSGFNISVAADPHTSAFDINQWLSAEYPGAVLATITPLTIAGQSGYEMQFANEVGAGQPLAVVYYQGYVYQISYASTFPSGSQSDLNGLNAFNAVLKNFTFTR